MTRLRVALVGAGIARAHAEAYAALPDLFELTTICSLDLDRGQALAHDFGPIFAVRHEPDFDSLLDQDNDIIDICTPPHLHYDFVKAALATNHHVICEKPLVASLAQLDDIATTLACTDRQLMPIFQYRFGTGFRKLQHLVARDLTGPLRLATIETHWSRGPDYYAVPWRGRWSTELGGALTTHAIHAHDMLLSIAGPPASLFAATATLINPIETEDTAALTVRFESGALAALSVTLGSAREISRLRFCFQHLTAESTLDPYTPGRDPWRFDPPFADAIASIPDAPDGYIRQFELFHAALTDGTPPPVTLADARRSLEFLTAAYHSARTELPVSLPLTGTHPLYGGWLP